MRNVTVKEIRTSSALTKSGLPELKYALNPYLGCLHGCVYCYAMDFTNDREAAGNWGSVIAVKINILEALKKDISRLSRGVVGVSTVTDPYQPVEGKYRLTRNSIDMLSRNGFRVSIQTRSPLVTRDLDIMQKNPGMFDLGMTIASPSESLTDMIEPGAPTPASRMGALRKASEMGIETWIFLGPLIRGFNDTDEQVSEIIEFAAENRSRVIYDKFSPYRGPAKLMENILPEGKYDYIRHADRKWWESMRSTIMKKCEKSGAKCNSQAEDWKYEKAKLVRPLTDF